GYSMIAYHSTLKGLSKLKLNTQNLADDLDNAWEIMAEPIQTVMRKAGIEKPYEKLKELTRGQKIDQETIRAFVENLDLKEADKQRLLEMSPGSYTGMASKIVDLLD
ncbi:MAG: adenylosuccinate lyase, partial [Desulfuromonadales bacterium]|nr:adenylosuccinate lyase [Desulfuromonadales bacterium]